MNVDGQCHCGKIQFKAEIDQERIVLCHCNDCQQLSGCAYRWVVFTREDALELTAETPRVYVKVAESGNEREQAFCDNCGSRIYATSVGEGPKRYGLAGGIINQRAELTPVRQVWQECSHAWTMEIAGLPATQKQWAYDPAQVLNASTPTHRPDVTKD